MIQYKFGDIVLILFSQPTGGAKKRPALVILDAGDDDIVLAPITTSPRKGKGDYKIKDWKESGLLMESWIRLAKIACLTKSDVEKVFGRITAKDKNNLASVWNKTYKFQ